MTREATNESGPVASGDDEKTPMSREELMIKASEVVAILHRRTTATLFRARQDDQARLSYARATVQAIAAYGGLLRDAEIADLAARLDRLEKRGAP